MDGYTNFVSGGWYISSNDGYVQMQDWDNTCKNINPHPLVERFRGSSGKIEVNATPIDNRVYYYSDYLCQIDYYPAYGLFEGEGGAYQDENSNNGDSGGGGNSGPSYDDDTDGDTWAGYAHHVGLKYMKVGKKSSGHWFQNLDGERNPRQERFPGKTEKKRGCMGRRSLCRGMVFS